MKRAGEVAMKTKGRSRSNASQPLDPGAGDPALVAEYLSRLAADLRSAHPCRNPAILPLNWNTMHVLSREEIAFGAALSMKIARQRWESLEPWLQLLLAESMLRRSWGRVALKGDEPITWGAADIS